MTTTTPTHSPTADLRHAAAALAADGRDVEAGVAELLAALTPDAVDAIIRGALASYVVRALRDATRAREAAAEAEADALLAALTKRSAAERTKALAAVPRSANLNALMRATVAVPGTGLRCSWGDLTAEQHAVRAAYLERQADSILASAERHRRAAHALETAKITTLNAALAG